MGKIDLYSFQKGVDVVRSPAHMEQETLLSGQNAVFDPNGVEGGIRKRGGLAKLNASALGGGASVVGATLVPLPDYGVGFTRYLYVALDSTTNTWRRSTDGTTWANVTSPSQPQKFTKLLDSTRDGARRLANYNGRMYFPEDDYVQYNAANHTPPPMRAWDGADQATAFVVPPGRAGVGTNAYAIYDALTVEDTIYVTVYDPPAGAPNLEGRVLAFSPQSGALSIVGNAFGSGTGEITRGFPISLAWWLGRLWAGTFDLACGALGRIVYIRPGIDETWTTDYDSPAGDGYVLDMAVYRGQLYAAFSADSGSDAKVRVRTTLGAWSTSDSVASGSGDANSFMGLCVFNDELYATYYDRDGGATPRILVRKFDGATWTTDVDVGTTYARKLPGAMKVFNSALYVTFREDGVGDNGFVLKRTTGGTWSNVDNNQPIRGFIETVDVY